MRPLARIVVHLAILSGLAALYFFRDFIFVNANSHMEYLRLIEGDPNADLISNYTHSKMVAFFGDWTREDIYKFKWIMTLSFTCAFALTGVLGFILSGLRKEAKWIAIFYGATFTLAFLLYFLSYTVSRNIIGLLHTPVPYLLFLIVVQLKRKMELHE